MTCSQYGNVVGLIPARAGSKGLPGKNIRLLNDQPLYLYSVHLSKLLLSRTIVSTDDTSIIGYCSDREDVELICRPPSLATDSAVMADVVRHAIHSARLSTEIIVLLQPTSPLRLPFDIISCLDLYCRQDKFSMIISVAEISSKYFKSGTVSSDSTFVPLRGSNDCFANRQSLPSLYSPSGSIYVFSAASFLEYGGFPVSKIGCYKMSWPRTIDIDSEEDFKKLEKIVSSCQFPGLVQF